MAEKQNNNVIRIGPQRGPQERFLACPADIAIYGGAAGGGKTYALLLEPVRHLSNPAFGGVIFRRTGKQIRNEGSLWDTSEVIYPFAGATPTQSRLEWTVEESGKAGWKMQFSHLEYEKNVLDWQGSQIPFIGFDELTHFTKKMFFYMVSRLRSTSGVPGYIRATTNPDATSWVREFIDWWIDKESGFAIPERDGVIRWFVRLDGKIVWGDSREELIEKYGEEQDPLSVTFIRSSVYDNKILLEKDPRYLSKLKGLDKVERARLLDGNWNIVPSAGVYFKRHYFEVIDVAPTELVDIVRCWDRAATEVKPGESAPVIDNGKKKPKDPDWTVGCKVGKTRQGQFVVLHLARERLSSLKVEQLILNTAKQDGPRTRVKLFQDPGSAGKGEAEGMVLKLAGFPVVVEKINVNKETAAKACSAQAEFGNIKVLKGPWNQDFFDELENFPEGTHDDQVDGLTGAFNELTLNAAGDWPDDKEEENKPLTSEMAW